jgi:hypothetical protein
MRLCFCPSSCIVYEIKKSLDEQISMINRASGGGGVYPHLVRDRKSEKSKTLTCAKST